MGVRTKKLLWRLVQATVSAAALAAVALSVDLRGVGPTLAHLRAGPVLLVLAVFAVSAWLRAVRLFLVVNQREQRLSLWRATVLTFAGAAIAFVSPSGGGELAQSYYAMASYGMRGGIVSSVLADRITAMSALLVLSAWPVWSASGPAVGALCLGGGLVLAAAVVWPRVLPWAPLARALAWISRRTVTPAELASAATLRGARGAAVFGLAGLGWVMTGLLYLAAADAVALDAPAMDVLLAVPLVALARMVPFSLNGLGFQEAALVATLSGRSNGAEAAALAVVLRLFGSLPAGILGVAALVHLASLGPGATEAARPNPEEQRSDL